MRDYANPPALGLLNPRDRAPGADWMQLLDTVPAHWKGPPPPGSPERDMLQQELLRNLLREDLPPLLPSEGENY